MSKWLTDVQHLKTWYEFNKLWNWLEILVVCFRESPFNQSLLCTCLGSFGPIDVPLATVLLLTIVWFFVPVIIKWHYDEVIYTKQTKREWVGSSTGVIRCHGFRVWSSGTKRSLLHHTLAIRNVSTYWEVTWNSWQQLAFLHNLVPFRSQYWFVSASLVRITGWYTKWLCMYDLKHSVTV